MTLEDRIQTKFPVFPLMVREGAKEWFPDSIDVGGLLRVTKFACIFNYNDIKNQCYLLHISTLRLISTVAYFCVFIFKIKFS